jgi:large subunit ribosomal protein L25
LATHALEAQPRTILGKKVQSLRKMGLVPANMYGHGRDSVPLQLQEKMVKTELSRAGHSSLFSLAIDGGDTATVLVKEVQRHPISGNILHIDFFRVAMGEKLRTTIPLHFVGESPAVKRSGGTPLYNLTTVDVSSLPGDLPHSIEVDISGLETLEDVIHVRDLAIPDGVELHSDSEEVVVKILAPAVSVEEDATEQTAVGAALPASE